MIELSDIQTVVLSKLESKLPAATVPAGKHYFDFVVRITGEAVKSPDTKQKPTSRSLTLEMLALFIHRAGIQREKALEILVDVLRNNVQLGDDQKVALLEITGVKEAKDRLDEELSKLPKTPKAGAFSIKDIKIETFGAKLVGDTFVPHAEKAKKTDVPTIPEISDE